MAMPIFSPLPSTAFPHRNHKSTSPICNFTLVSVSIFSKKTQPVSRKSFYVYNAAVASPVAPETSGSGTSGGNSTLDISKLGISDEIVSALSRRGITELFPIQRAVFDPAMKGHDMIGRAITGSGKTLAFAIPILDNIIRHQSPRRKKRVPSALVLAPTRELARQVQKEFKESAPKLSSACLYGGVPIINQIRMLGVGIDIAVGTPGRIIDLVERDALNLSEVNFVVLDEADQMLAVGFQEDVECILSYLPAKKQCMLFSATMPSWVNELSGKYLRDPVMIDLVGGSDQKLADGISLYSVMSTASGKENVLPTLISKYNRGGKSIIFTKTKRDAEELSRSMESILASRALHGNMNQFQRDKTLAAFRDGRFDVLVATDVAARGLDIPNVDLVVHYEMPNTSEIFVHRSGRTGRAGKEGTAVLIYTRAQQRAVRFIERDIGCKFEELPRISNGSLERFGSGGTGMQRLSYSNADRPFGNQGSRRNTSYNFDETRSRHSKAFKLSKDQFGDYESSNKSHFARNLVPGNNSSVKSRTQRHSFDELRTNHTKEKNVVDERRRRDDFQEILEMFRNH